MGRSVRLAVQASVSSALLLALLTPGCSPSAPNPGKSSRKDEGGFGAGKPPRPRPGLSLNDPRAFQGFTLLVPMTSTKTYLLDMQGKVVRMWQSDCYPALGAALLHNGHLLRSGTLDMDKRPFGGAGAGGRVQEFTWDGDLVWDYTFANASQLPHHDLTKLPNGNVLLVVWENKTSKDAVAAGCRPDGLEGGHLRADCLIEIKPTGKTTGQVVWEWHVWDHLIQDHDKTRANYGDVAAHPELVDINYSDLATTPLLAKKDGVDKLASIGYLRPDPGGSRPPGRGWTHINSVAYHLELDQIALSVHGFSEIWIIDHSTTTAEAAGHRGGRSGKGGDLLYRWGNPRAYRAGSAKDQQLFAQHDAHWIPRGLPGEGHLLVFNNGGGRPAGDFSSVDETVPPVDAKGRYERRPGVAYGPKEPVWSYTAPRKADLYSELLSSAQRLGNGDTLICSGMDGRIFEVTPKGEIVWEYRTPVHTGPAPTRAPWAGPGRSRAPSSSSVFRATRYAPDHPGLVGKDLTPGKTVLELR
jgi:hypothetical protein